MFKLFNKYFFNGLVIVLPITLTIYLILFLSKTMENFFAPLLRQFIGATKYVPGLGIVFTVLFIILVGFLVSNFVTGRVIKKLISFIEKVPFIKAIYSPLKDLMGLFAQNSESQMKKVVAVKLSGSEFETIGLITRENFNDLGVGIFGDNRVAVYIPMSYMVGGFTAILPRESIREVDIPVETALKLALTGWIKSEQDD